MANSTMYASMRGVRQRYDELCQGSDRGPRAGELRRRQGRRELRAVAWRGA